MSIKGPYENGGNVEFHVSGVISKHDIKGIRSLINYQSSGAEKRILITLDDFNGWSGEPDEWSDISSVEEVDPHILKIAVVGDLKWKEQIEMFLMKGLRGFPIEYFSPDQLDFAKAWLR